MPATSHIDTDWGPLAEPIDPPELGAASKPWRDNMFFCFWDPAKRLTGVMHCSTSPNAEGRRARVSIALGDASVEVIEELGPGTFSSESITVDMTTGFEIDSPRLSGRVDSEPLHALAPYSGDSAPQAFGLDEQRPLQHFQRAARVTGRLVIDGEEVEISGYGFRDRTWGFRDESESVQEYYGWMWVFGDFSISAMRLLDVGGGDHTLGWILHEDGSRTTVTHASIVRDASGLFAEVKIEMEDGSSMTIANTERHSTFWCPMGWKRSGPVLSAYDELGSLRTDAGVEGFGLLEQGILRRLG